MADEAQVTSSLYIRRGNITYQSNPARFTATVTGVKGPTPGAFTVSIYGTNVNFDQLDTPGLCRIMNLDDTNYVEYGAWDSETLRFYPVGKLLPGETYVIRLAGNLGEEFGTGTGTGTLTQPTNTFRMRANYAECVVLVEAFEE